MDYFENEKLISDLVSIAQAYYDFMSDDPTTDKNMLRWVKKTIKWGKTKTLLTTHLEQKKGTN